MSSSKRKPRALIILDGWGYRPDREFNAIAMAHTPVWDRMVKERPNSLLASSGHDVGLPPGQMGNSEVGHMNLGAGRVVYQVLSRISMAVEDGSFFSNEVLVDAASRAAKSGGSVHIFGLLSPGGVHSHEDQIRAAAGLAHREGATAVYMHAFLDGRDVPPRSAEESLAKMDDYLKSQGAGRIATICGRFYGMDRDKRWERTELAYHLVCSGEAEFVAASPREALADAYARDENDEFVKPTRVGEPEPIRDGDSVIFMNFRADRARQLTRAFTEEKFDAFTRRVRPRLAAFATLTQYADDIDASFAYGPMPLPNGLGEYLESLGLTQLRVAETEKYAHVTFFFSGGREAPYRGEERILVPSPKVATYDLKPEMSAIEMTDRLVAAIESGAFDMIVCNYANGDMVGHTGDLGAAIKAVECVDGCLGRIVAAIEKMGGEALITADHGNCEQMRDEETGQPHTAHTSGPVPLIYIGTRQLLLRQSGGVLADIAPTLLTLMELPQPDEMTGHSMILAGRDLDQTVRAR